MTREEAIKNIKEHCYFANLIPQAKEALDMAIKALEQEPCEDCISRHEALKELKESAEHHANDSREEALLRRDRDIIRALPPVTPQPKTGHWILTDDDFVYCSECEDSYYPRPIDASWYFCPNCGAKMESEE